MTNTSSALSPTTVILASGSKTRAALLENAGVGFEALRPTVDEDALKESLAAENTDGADTALFLATAKAVSVSRQHPGRLVVGADQVLECDSRIFGKPADRDSAAAQLNSLSGKSHEQISAVCVVLDGELIWHHVDRARLAVRTLTDDFINIYLDAIGPAAEEGPGAYQLEGPGAHLFSYVGGDYFTILGLPLLPLLDFLRARGALAV